MTQSRQKSRGFQILWTILTTLVIVSFGALLYYGREVYQMAPPIPEQVITNSGQPGVALQWRRDSGRPRCMARDRWTPAWIDLGPWRLYRTGLDR